MNVFRFLTLSLLIVCCSGSIENYDLIISNVDLIDGTGNPLQTKVSVCITSSIIQKITTDEIVSAQQIIDGSGKYLMPGLFDCHVHTTSYETDFSRLVHYGVTSIFVPGGSTASNEEYAQMRGLGNQNVIPAPRVFHTSQHFTMEGRHPVKTYASSNWEEGKTVFYLRDTAQISALVNEVAKYPIKGIKLTIEDGPAPPFVERMPQAFINKTVEEASKYGLDVFAHVSDNEEFLMAVKGGAQNLVHFVGIDIDWENEEHVSAVSTLIDQNGSIITTLMIDKSFLYPLNPEWMEVSAFNDAYPQETLKELLTPQAITKAKRMEEMTRQYLGFEEITMENLYLSQIEDIKKLMELKLNIALGTDTGNDFNFHGYSLHEEMQIMEMGGIDQLDILRMGTLNAAKMLDVSDSLGTIEIGKYADMILLNKNPLESIVNSLAIDVVFKNGVVQKRISSE